MREREQLLGQVGFLSRFAMERYAPTLDVAIEFANGQLETVRRGADRGEKQLVLVRGQVGRRWISCCDRREYFSAL